MQITWYGHSAFRLDFAGKAVLIDPFFTGNPAFVSDKAAAIRGATHIVLTHGHADHVGDALDISAATGAPVITNYDLCMWLAGKGLQKFDPMNTGGTTDQGSFTVRSCVPTIPPEILPTAYPSISATRAAPSSRRPASPPSTTWATPTSSPTWA
jgi:L-ascorbate metabolism protein UlaG (beta-lactamase superfamily)